MCGLILKVTKILRLLKKSYLSDSGKSVGLRNPWKKTERGARIEPSAIKRSEGFYAWWGKNTEMVLSYSKDRHKGTLTINSTMISEERRTYEKEKEKEREKEKRLK